MNLEAVDRAIQRHIHANKIMEASRYSSGVETERFSAEEIIIFTGDPTGVTEEREVDIERWEIQIAHECRGSGSNQREEQDGEGDRGVLEDD